MKNEKKDICEYISGWWAPVADSDGQYSCDEPWWLINFNCNVDTIISYEKLPYNTNNKYTFTVYTPYKGYYSIQEGYLIGGTKDDWHDCHKDCVFIWTSYIDTNVQCGDLYEDPAGEGWLSLHSHLTIVGDKLLVQRKDRWAIYQKVKGFK